jgi:PBSX family phage terminase large subunit
MSAVLEAVKKFEVRGKIIDGRLQGVAGVFKCRDEEILIHGPAGTGKTRGNLEKLHLVLTKYSNARGLLVRKTRSSLTNTGIVTYEKEVLAPGDHCPFHTPSQSYKYPNGSSLVVGGLDDSTKIMSSQYDIVLGIEATEFEEDDLQDIKTRLRNFVVPYQQVILDCNPAPPSHWLYRRMLAGQITGFTSVHEDNPVYYDKVKKEWTDKGKAYLKTLDALTGVRYKRLRLGIWCAAEGMVYDNWNADIHLINHMDIPAGWDTIWILDFGYTHPFVWQCWAIDTDGRMYLKREIYRTQRTVTQHAKLIKSLNEPRPRAIICDHDAEDRATFEAEIGMSTLPAEKAITTGIQCVTDRLRIAGDGKPRIYIMKDCLIEKDPNLESKKLPLSTAEEFDSYVWDDSTEKRKEVPIKRFDHGMDSLRYAAMYLDSFGKHKPGIFALT